MKSATATATALIAPSSSISPDLPESARSRQPGRRDHPSSAKSNIFGHTAKTADDHKPIFTPFPPIPIEGGEIAMGVHPASRMTDHNNDRTLERTTMVKNVLR